jgi:hypothetical protein
MNMSRTKLLDISDYGFSGGIVSIREPIGSDMVAINDFIIKEKKEKGEANAYKVSLLLLSRVIVEAPFDKSVASLQEQPLSLLTYLDEEVTKMISPLAKKE